MSGFTIFLLVVGGFNKGLYGRLGLQRVHHFTVFILVKVFVILEKVKKELKEAFFRIKLVVQYWLLIFKFFQNLGKIWP